MAKRDRPVIQSFLQRCAELRSLAWALVSWPEDQERTKPVIDCLARSADGLRNRWPGYYLRVTLPYKPGVKWSRELREILGQWLLDNFEHVPETGRASELFEPQIPGVPWPTRISKRRSNQGGVHLSRFEPPGARDHATLDERMRRGLGHKYDALDQRRQADCVVTIQLLENQDIGLIDTFDWYRSFLRVTWANPHGALNQVWLADNLEAGKERYTDFYCFRGDHDLMMLANPEGFYFGPTYDDNWQQSV